VQSQYSHIRVIDGGGQRALHFDDKYVQTLIDRNAPYRLQHAYTRTMMVGLLYPPETGSVLLIGLGGGAVVQFLNRNFPDVRVDAVEIDPEVVKVARDYFGTTSGPRTRIIVADGGDYLERSAERYDVVLLDAFLHPREGTDATGHPLSLQTEAFYRSVHERLRPGGVAVFNVLAASEKSYLATICSAFAATHVVWTPGSNNAIAVARPTGAMPDEFTLLSRARAMDKRDLGFSFEQALKGRERAQCPS
jgi:spermidine synthase